MKTLLLALALAIGGDWQDALLRIVGASSPEDLDESVLEHFETLQRRPLDLNSAGVSRLRSSGLLSDYQVATILDYRSMHGDILSFTELSTIDGIGTELAEDLRFFIILEPVRRGGRTDVTGSARAVAKMTGNDEPDLTMGAKAKVTSGRLEAAVAYRESLGGNLTIYGKRRLGKVVLGDYNARFGQGLALWSGFSMSGLSSVASFSRNPSGISPSNSYSATSHMRGLAADWNFGRLCLSTAASTDGSASANVISRRSTWQISATAAAGRDAAVLSTDWKVGMKDRSFYGEAAFDPVNGSAAFLAGYIWVPQYGRKLTMLVRYYPSSYHGFSPGAVRSSTKTSDEAAVSFGCQNKWLLLTADALLHPSKQSCQLKFLSVVSRKFEMSGYSIVPSLRLSERLRSGTDAIPARTDLRFDLDVSREGWMAHYRFNALACRDLAWMWYLEAGYKGKFSIYLRGGIFKVDNWDDRIYVYERDAPGSFNVPVYYGRGWNASLVAVWRKITVRLSSIRYPWTLPVSSPKPSRLEFRAQLGF